MAEYRRGASPVSAAVAAECQSVTAEVAMQARTTRRALFLFLLLIASALSLASFSEQAILEGLGVDVPGAQVSNFHIVAVAAFAALILGTVSWEFGLLRKTSIDEALAWFESVYWVLRVGVACGTFMIVGPILTVLNKHIMQQRGFAYPLTLSSIGVLSSSIVAHIAVLFCGANIRPESREVVTGRKFATIILPICMGKAMTLSAGNMVYLHLGLGFIQMLKAFCPCVVLIVMYLAGVEMPSRVSSWCALVIVAGTMVEVRGELAATTFGLLLMLFSEVFEAIHLVLSAKLMQNHKFSVLEGMYFIAGPSGALILLVAAFTEWPDMVENGGHLIIFEQPLEIISAAVLGVLVNFLSFFVVQLTSPATLKILNTVRGIGLVVFGIVFYGETITSLQAAGYAVALIGFLGYNYFQIRRGQAAALEAWVDRCVSQCTGSGANLPSDAGFDNPCLVRT